MLNLPTKYNKSGLHQWRKKPRFLAALVEEKSKNFVVELQCTIIFACVCTIAQMLKKKKTIFLLKDILFYCVGGGYCLL